MENIIKTFMFTNRIDAEVSTLRRQLDELRASYTHHGDGHEMNAKPSSGPTIEVSTHLFLQLNF